MLELLNHPAVQGGVAPLVAGVLVALALVPLRASGVAVMAGFLAAVYLVGNFSLETLTATRKVVVVAAVAGGVGLIADLAFKPTRRAGVVLGLVFAAAGVWVFWTVIAQKPILDAAIVVSGVCGLVAWTVAATLGLHTDTARAGAAGVGLGTGAGIAAVVGASALLGQYGLALGAASGGVVLAFMGLGRKVVAGATLVLFAATAAALIAAASVILAQVPWYAAALLALVPLAVRLPLPAGAPWLQAVVAVVYAGAPAILAAGAAWWAGRGAG